MCNSDCKNTKISFIVSIQHIKANIVLKLKILLLLFKTICYTYTKYVNILQFAVSTSFFLCKLGRRRPPSTYDLSGEDREHGISGEYFDDQLQTTRYCCKCGTTFSMMSTLKRHLVEMEKKEVLKCEGCGKNFYRQRNLKRHKK